MELTFDEIMHILDIKKFPSEKRVIPYHLEYKKSDSNKRLACFLTNYVKVSVTIDDIRKKSNLNNDQTLFFSKKSFSIHY